MSDLREWYKKNGMTIMLVLLVATVAMMFMQKKNPPQQPQEQKAQEQEPAAKDQAGADDKDETSEKTDAKKKSKNEIGPEQVLEKVLAFYDKHPVYQVHFYMQQPHNAKEAKNLERLEKIREEFLLKYSKKADADPQKDYIRLDGMHGYNRCTDVGYSPEEKQAMAYHSTGTPMKLPPGDKRLGDFFKTGMHMVARDVVSMLEHSDYKTVMKLETHSFPPLNKDAKYYVLTMTRPQEKRVVTYVDSKTFEITAQEIMKYNRKGKTESDKYPLKTRRVWFGFQSIKEPDKKVFTGISRYESRKCMR